MRGRGGREEGTEVGRDGSKKRGRAEGEREGVII